MSNTLTPLHGGQGNMRNKHRVCVQRCFRFWRRAPPQPSYRTLHSSQLHAEFLPDHLPVARKATVKTPRATKPNKDSTSPALDYKVVHTFLTRALAVKSAIPSTARPFVSGPCCHSQSFHNPVSRFFFAPVYIIKPFFPLLISPTIPVCFCCTLAL